MQPKLDHKAAWEELIASVDKDQIPLDCVKKVLFKLKGGKQKTVNLSKLKRDGLDIEQIETVITRNMSELHGDLVNMDFIIDIESVADSVQRVTNRYLEKL